MNKIRILPEAVANKIAAGEVVERPASAFKELVENAVDAGSTRILAEIKGGGRSLIRVADNGCGMSRDDALLCLERHATSKIKTAADIEKIGTLGFRGEALPSLAAVSRFRLVTREADALEGTEVEASGGKIQSVRAAGCPAGTSVELRQLYFNVPARKKFMRSEATELAQIHHLGVLYAAAYPEIQWTLRNGEKPLVDTPAAAGLRERIIALFGAPLFSELVSVDGEGEGLRLRGFTSKPGLARSTRREMHLFVNRRPVESRAVSFGIIEGYHNALMKGKFPVSFLFVEIDPEQVDVNIHPAKREVRFRSESAVQAAIAAAVRAGLEKAGHRPVAVSMGIQLTPGAVSYPSDPAFAPLLRESFAQAPPRDPSPMADSQLPIADVQSQIANRKSQIHAVHGIVDQLYILAENESGLVIVDQHAAHERVLYERMLEQLSKKEASSQRLLLPQTVELSAIDAAALREQLPLLEKMGFGVSEFGKNAFMVDSLPPHLSPAGLCTLLREIVDALREAGQGVNRERFREEMVAKKVCRAAVKANDPLGSKEAGRLIQDLLACRQPYCCPHGRPTMIQVTRAELDRKFGRTS